MSSKPRLGFGKKIRWDWFLLALRLRARGASYDEARDELAELIAVTNSGKEAIVKSLSVIRQVVFQPDPFCSQFCNNGIELFRVNGEAVALPIMWGLSISAYSFFARCSETMGRLLRLHGEFAAAEMLRRVTEREGDREFVIRIAQFNLSTTRDWEVIEYDAKSKRYKRGKVAIVTFPDISAWLAEGVLLASGRTSMPLPQLLTSNILFPFDLRPVSVIQLTRANPRLQVLRQSLNEELVALHDSASR